MYAINYILHCEFVQLCRELYAMAANGSGILVTCLLFCTLFLGHSKAETIPYYTRVAYSKGCRQFVHSFTSTFSVHNLLTRTDNCREEEKAKNILHSISNRFYTVYFFSSFIILDKLNNPSIFLLPFGWNHFHCFSVGDVIKTIKSLMDNHGEVTVLAE